VLFLNVGERQTRFRERFTLVEVCLRIIRLIDGIKFVQRDDSRDSIDRTLESVVYIDLLIRSSTRIIW